MPDQPNSGRRLPFSHQVKGAAQPSNSGFSSARSQPQIWLILTSNLGVFTTQAVKEGSPSPPSLSTAGRGCWASQQTVADFPHVSLPPSPALASIWDNCTILTVLDILMTLATVVSLLVWAVTDGRGMGGG